MSSVASVCLSVSVCLFSSGSNFWKPWPRNFVFDTQVHLHNIYVKFVFEGHEVRVKVTAATPIDPLLLLRMRKAFSAPVVQHLPSSVFIFPRLELLTISLDRHSVEREVKGYIDASEMQCCQKSMKKHDVRLDAGRWIPASLDYSIIPNRELRRKTNQLMINVRNPIQSQSPSRQPGKRQCHRGVPGSQNLRHYTYMYMYSV